MKAIEINGEITVFPNLPKTWEDENGLHLNIGDGYHLGFKDVILPEHDPEIEILDNIHLFGDIYTYDVVPYDIPETVEELKINKLEELDRISKGTLLNTDWYIVREFETGVQTPQEIKDERAAIRLKDDQVKQEINALSDKIEIIKYVISI